MKKFEFRPDVAVSDCAFYAYGKDLPELIEHACEAVTETMVDLRKIEPKKTVLFEAKADSPEELLYKVLEELIFLKDSKQLVFGDFETVASGNKSGIYTILIKFIGEKLKPAKHEPHADVKAVTYHEFEVKKMPYGLRASVTLDT